VVKLSRKKTRERFCGEIAENLRDQCVMLLGRRKLFLTLRAMIIVISSRLGKEKKILAGNVRRKIASISS
jgi:hypothetical protein